MAGKALDRVTRCCAHRGAPDTHPENTVAAFREAVRLGADMIEFDVGMTADGAAMILHDGSVDRTTDGTGGLASLTFDQVRELDAGSHRDAKFAGEPIPTLVEALEAIPSGIVLNVHVKPAAGVVAETVSTLQRVGRAADAVLAGEADQMRESQRLCPELRRCNLGRQGQADYLDLCVELGVPWLQYSHAQVTEASVAAAHERGITVNCFYANDEAEMRRQIECGVDYILTDHPALLLRVLGRCSDETAIR